MLSSTHELNRDELQVHDGPCAHLMFGCAACIDGGGPNPSIALPTHPIHDVTGTERAVVSPGAFQLVSVLTACYDSEPRADFGTPSKFFFQFVSHRPSHEACLVYAFERWVKRAFNKYGLLCSVPWWF